MTERARTVDLIRAYFTAQHHLRKGICLLNAHQFDQAAEALSQAREVNPDSRDLVQYLITALIQAKRYGDAATELASLADASDDAAGAVRLAYLTWRSGDPEEAIRCLRQALSQDTESPALHFHLGTMLAGLDQYEEAELRFSQVLSLDKNHVDALVSLALCHGAQRRPQQAMEHLERAQNLRPHDVRITLLLTQAAKAVQHERGAVSVRAEMPPDARPVAAAAIDELAALLERDPDFAEAFVAIDAAEVDEEAYSVLLVTLKRALERSPHRPNLHYLRGQILARLGRNDEAIAATERAVDLDPRYVQALLFLAKLYQTTNRRQDAAVRLEETVRLGAEYADTYFILGNLYRDTGRLERARWAYENALRLNSRFEAARAALATLAA
jgi:superkiller protein 3